MAFPQRNFSEKWKNTLKNPVSSPQISGFSPALFPNTIKNGGFPMSDCLFCKIAAGDIPSDKLYEDELVLAFRDIDPQAPTHFLVIPKAHIPSAAAVTEENAPVVAHALCVIAKLTKELGVDSFRVVSNVGEQAGQSVFLLHFHVLAGRAMGWPPFPG
jgi:histidine triad (HIT) family protein